MVYRRTDKTTERLAKNRERLLKTARQLVEEGGFENVQISVLASLSGVAPGTVYRYFPSKGDLLAEVAREGYQRELDVINDILSSPGNFKERFIAAIEAFLQRALRNKSVAFAMLAEQVENQVGIERMDYREKLMNVFARLIQAGIDQGQLPQQDAHITAAIVTGGFMEALLSPLAPSSGASKQELFITKTIEACLRVIGLSREDISAVHKKTLPINKQKKVKR